MDNSSALGWVQKWFHENCDGDWEHNTTIKIVNLDNPGWSVCINVEGTNLESKKFDLLKDYRTDNDWVFCKLENTTFKAACGPFNLEEVLNIFRKWAES